MCEKLQHLSCSGGPRCAQLNAVLASRRGNRNRVLERGRPAERSNGGLQLGVEQRDPCIRMCDETRGQVVVAADEEAKKAKQCSAAEGNCNGMTAAKCQLKTLG